MKSYYIKNTGISVDAKSKAQALAKFRGQGLNGVKASDVKRQRRVSLETEATQQEEASE